MKEIAVTYLDSESVIVVKNWSTEPLPWNDGDDHYDITDPREPV